jgi:molybdopterin converting factor subunit 1
MIVQVKLFAILRDRAGVSELSLELPDPSRVVEAKSAIVQRLPQIGPFLARAAFAVNREYVHEDAVLHDGDEIALIPPVSGG